MSFRTKLDNVLQSNKGTRVLAFEYEGKTYWLKQAEKLKGIMRIVKGSATAALQREACALQGLNFKNAPVPKVVCQDVDFFVVEDSGRTVKDWLQQADVSDGMLSKILTDSSMALAELHHMNLAHGRPALRDICWENGKVTFIDFESFFFSHSIEKRQARDLILFIHSLYRYLDPKSPQILHAIESYRTYGGEQAWQNTKKQLQALQWLYYILYPFRFRGGKDVKPIFWVLKHFR